MTCIDAPATEMGPDIVPEQGDRDDLPLARAVAEGSAQQNELYVRYRRPLLQVLLRRGIAHDVAEDLLQLTFIQAIKKIRSGELNDPSNLGGYLYRTACNLAIVYWRGEFAREYDRDSERLANIPDEALSLEERVDHEQLAKCVRSLMIELPLRRDREVLERFYLHEEPRAEIRQSLRLTELQFNQVLWRARQRFGDILRKKGLVSANTASGI